MAPASGIHLNAQQIFSLIEEVRSTKPLVHNITNFVAMNFSANVLLAAGASPIMAHAPEELEDLIRISHALTVNIGTLDRAWIESMRQSLRIAKSLQKPVAFDPVGVGASRLRTETAHELLQIGATHVIRGNASEIKALAGGVESTKGVDSLDSSKSALNAARSLSEKYKCLVCVSGEVDYLVQDSKIIGIQNGHPMMTQVTAMGCSATSLIGAFLGVNTNTLHATQAAMALMSLAGEKAAAQSSGPGSFQMHFLDALANLSGSDFSERLKTQEIEL